VPRTGKFAAALLVVALVASQGGIAASCDDYTCPAYAQADLQNMIQSVGRLVDEYTDVPRALAFEQKALEVYAQHWLAQASDPKHPAASAGFLIPGGMMGDIGYWPKYEAWTAEGRVKEVRFRHRTGSLITGHVWKPPGAGPFPAVTITPGSVQATEPMYWWASEMLVDAGYTVLTFDAQGQGRSEVFGHTDDANESFTTDGFPSQQAVNFHEMTVDAIEFMLSTPSEPLRYAFSGDATAGYDTFNPFHASIEYLPDGFANLGLAGHSFGASGVTYAQDATINTLNVRNIRTIVAWDNLASGYTPNVPAMAQNGESFVEPSFNPRRPDPESKKGAFNRWRAAGIDTMQVATRAATHLEWSFVPGLPLAASSWGNAIVAHYTLAWFDKYLRNDPTADARLLTKAYRGSGNENCGGNDGCYSIYYKNAYAFHDAGGAMHSCDDVAHIAAPAESCPDTDL
jgi:hypothetical protein